MDHAKPGQARVKNNSGIVMQQDDIHAAASQLIRRRQHKQRGPRLVAKLRPTDNEQALAVQQAIIEQMQDSVGGWKCLLPIGDKVIAAPIFSSTICSQSPLVMQTQNGLCRIEPEIAFCLARDLPSRELPYNEAEIDAAFGSAHLALELIFNRFVDTENVPFAEALADCLFNQGLFIGPEIPLAKGYSGSEFVITVSQTHSNGELQTRQFNGKHPNHYPQLPLYWLVNFLSSRGISLFAGQQIITGSFAGVIEVLPELQCSIAFQGLGVIQLSLLGQN